MSEREDREMARRKERVESMKSHTERREMPDSEMEIRDRPGGVVLLAGYGAVTETPYPCGEFTETMARGFCRRTLGEHPDVVLVTQHAHVGSGLPLARTKSARGGPGTLRLYEDDHGLGFEADLDPEDSDSALVIRKLRRGDLDGQMSFGFRVLSDAWNRDYSERRVTTVSLNRGDLSLVVQAANPAAMATLRAEEEARRAARVGVATLSTQALAASNSEREQLALARHGFYVPRHDPHPAPASDYARAEREQLAKLRRGA
jgi:HK97 family phage prohead protease